LKVAPRPLTFSFALLARNVKQVKEQRKELEKSNKETTQDLYKEISRMIGQHEQVKSHRERLEKQLQEVKTELAEYAATEDRERDSGTSIFSMMTDDSIDASGAAQSAPTSPFFAINQVISAYSGVQIGEFGDDRISFHLAVHAAGKLHHFTLSVDFEPFNDCAIRNVSISPEFSPLEPVFKCARDEDTQFLITESIHRIRNYLELKQEIEHLQAKVPSVVWREQEGFITFTRELISAYVSLPYDYPTFEAPSLLEVRIDGVVNHERKVSSSSFHPVFISLSLSFSRMRSTP